MYWIRQDEIVIVESISKSILIVVGIAIIDVGTFIENCTANFTRCGQGNIVK